MSKEEKIEEITSIIHKLTFFECEELTDKQAELTSDIIDLLYDLKDELKKGV